MDFLGLLSGGSHIPDIRLLLLPFLLLAAGSGFMGLILRVVKNVFAEAIFIKEENDFTI